LKDNVLQPLGLNSTGFTQPLASSAIIPVVEGLSFFDIDIGNYNA
jgi:CubicO group peptidase (beta-lactamase class C family)